MIAFRILSPHVRELGFRNLENFCLWSQEFEKFFSVESEIQGCDPFNQNSDRSDREKWSTSKGAFFRNFSGWTEPVHRVLDRSFRKFWSNGSRPWALKSGILAAIIAIRNPEVPLTKNPESSSGNPDYHTGHGQSTVKTTSFILIQAFQKKNWRNYNHY